MRAHRQTQHHTLRVWWVLNASECIKDTRRTCAESIDQMHQQRRRRRWRRLLSMHKRLCTLLTSSHSLCSCLLFFSFLFFLYSFPLRCVLDRSHLCACRNPLRCSNYKHCGRFIYCICELNSRRIGMYVPQSGHRSPSSPCHYSILGHCTLARSDRMHSCIATECHSMDWIASNGSNGPNGSVANPLRN